MPQPEYSTIVYVAVFLALQVTATLKVIDIERKNPVIPNVLILQERSTAITPAHCPTHFTSALTAFVCPPEAS